MGRGESLLRSVWLRPRARLPRCLPRCSSTLRGWRSGFRRRDLGSAGRGFLGGPFLVWVGVSGRVEEEMVSWEMRGLQF